MSDLLSSFINSRSLDIQQPAAEMSRILKSPDFCDEILALI
jgi:hypothetical protein